MSSEQQNDSSKIVAALIVGAVSVIIGSFMANVFAGIVIGGLIAIFLIADD